MNDDKPLLRKCLNLLCGVMLFLNIPTISYTPPVVLETYQLVIRGGNSVVGYASPGLDESLHSLTGLTELDRIIKAESDNRWWVKNPNGSAYGYCQFIRKTRLYVEEKWGMTIDWLDPEQQLYACKRLYLEEGNSHWDASRDKWDK